MILVASFNELLQPFLKQGHDFLFARELVTLIQ